MRSVCGPHTCWAESSSSITGLRFWSSSPLVSASSSEACGVEKGTEEVKGEGTVAEVATDMVASESAGSGLLTETTLDPHTLDTVKMNFVAGGFNSFSFNSVQEGNGWGHRILPRISRS